MFQTKQRRHPAPGVLTDVATPELQRRNECGKIVGPDLGLRLLAGNYNISLPVGVTAVPGDDTASLRQFSRDYALHVARPAAAGRHYDRHTRTDVVIVDCATIDEDIGHCGKLLRRPKLACNLPLRRFDRNAM